MPDEPDKPRAHPPEAKSDDDAEASSSTSDARPLDEGETDRPTVSPPFDPIAFAREVLKPSPAPMAAISLPTPNAQSVVTPPHGTGNALPPVPRKKTPPGLGDPLPPPPAPPAREVRRKTPTSTLSLANARIPSNLPPRLSSPASATAPSKRPTVAAKPNPQLDPVENEWADLELSTRPPPADGPGEDPVVEIGQERRSSLDLDDVEARGREEHAADTVRRPLTAELTGPARHREMNDRVSLGDYSGALEIAEKILADTPTDAAATACAESCRTVLRQMYATRIGPLDRVPVVMVPRDQLRWLSIDHKAGFVLSLVDGVSSLEMIIDVSGMPELDTLRILSELAQQRIISLR